MNKIMVTGANGFIGSALLNEIAKDGAEIIAIIRNQEEPIEHIKKIPKVRIYYCELSEIDKLQEIVPDRDIDAVIHLAWAGSTGDARAEYNLQLLNVKYALDTLNVANKMNIKRFVGAGTLAEKDVLNYHPTDNATPNAVSIYGIAKISTHFMTKAECTKLGMDHIWCYLSNTYGVGNITGNFVNFASKLMLTGGRAAFTSGEQTYDFVYVTDTVRAIYAAATKGKKNTAYYLGSTKQRKLKEFITIIRDTIDPSIELHLGEIPFNGIALDAKEFDASKLVEDTGFVPEVAFEEGIKWTVDWLRTQM